MVVNGQNLMIVSECPYLGLSGIPFSPFKVCGLTIVLFYVRKPYLASQTPGGKQWDNILLLVWEELSAAFKYHGKYGNFT